MAKGDKKAFNFLVGTVAFPLFLAIIGNSAAQLPSYFPAMNVWAKVISCAVGGAFMVAAFIIECIVLYKLAKSLLKDYEEKQTDIQAPPIETVTRFETIMDGERLVVKYGIKAELSFQDDNRTLKVFLTDRENKEAHA